MEDYMEHVSAEVAVLRRKLQSKAEALLILTQELDQCRAERDQFKLLAEQTQNKNGSKKNFDDQVSKAQLPFSNGIQSSSFDYYLDIKEQNKSLKYEIQDLKQKLREAYGDIKVLRAGTADSSQLMTGKEATPAHQREELVEQLEQMSGRVSQLESDLRGVLDEKEELITERESYRAKVFRLNHQINTLLKCDSARLIDLDALIMDNKYQQEQLQQLKAEKELAQQALVRYKSMLEKKKNKGIVKLGNNNSTMVVSHKQVQELLQRGTAVQMPNTEATLDDLRSLCLALLEALQDKTLALAHQRKANKILASRISELEHRLGANVPVFPSELLMQAYSSADSDRQSTDHSSPHDQSQDKPKSKETLFEDKTISGCSNTTVLDETIDTLPEDIQELVTKALQQIHEESKAS